jgi:CubicO group peptidase (beta-lactamase class C family)
MDHGGGGVATTARNLLAFVQMLLAGGRCGDRRILSRASAAAMTRRQVDVEGPRLTEAIVKPTGAPSHGESTSSGYGHGLFVFGSGDRSRVNGALVTPSSFGHSGFGSSYFWADPAQHLAAAYLSVSPRMAGETYASNAGLFQNAVYAAIIE